VSLILNNIVNSISPLELSQLEGYSFMNRMDTKYPFSFKLLPELLGRISEQYKVLEINGVRDLPYRTTYFDTPDNLFFNQHTRGFVERYKVRCRLYETNGESFLEVKHKNIKGRTQKWRISKNDNCLFDNESIKFLFSYVSDSAFNVRPVLKSRFNRITLIGVNTKERITFDHNISFSNGNGEPIRLPYLAIAEVKRDSHLKPSPFTCALKDMLIRSSGFSKYCVGRAIVNNIAKAHLMKPTLHSLQKIENEYNVYSA